MKKDFGRKLVNSIKTEILDFSVSYDVIGLCETRLTDSTAKTYELSNYTLFTNNICSLKGGVALYINNKFECKVFERGTIKKEHFESLFVECNVDNRPLYIGMIYHRPGTSIELFKEDLSNIISKIGSNCMLLGDFNVNLLNDNIDHATSSFINNLREYSFDPVIIKPTRVFNTSISIIDHIWVHFRPISYHRSNILFTGITDHFPVVYHHELRSPITNGEKITFL